MEQELEVELFGRKGSMNYSESWLGYSILGLRFLLAWVFIQAGVEKILAGNWSSAGYLGGLAEANPFYALFQFFATYSGIVDPMVMYEQILVGLALLLGAAFKFSAGFGGLMIAFFWLSSFQVGFMAGLPIQHGYVVTKTLIYAVLLFGLGAWGAGRLLRVDDYLEQQAFLENNEWLKYFLA